MTTKTLNIGKAVYELLKDIAPCFPLIAEQGTQYPFIVYRRNSFSYQDTKDYYNIAERVSMDVTIAANTYEESIELALRVKERMEKTRGEFNGVSFTDCETVNSSEDWIDDAYVQTLTFSILID